VDVAVELSVQECSHDKLDQLDVEEVTLLAVAKKNADDDSMLLPIQNVELKLMVFTSVGRS
jgi:hypothetical protein